jgi:murein DD-endopeptidase / murein LD-carboxypeptidase
LNINKRYHFEKFTIAIVITLVWLFIAGCVSSKKSGSKYKANVISFGKKDSLENAKQVTEIKKYDVLQIQYSKKLSVAPDSIFNLRLYHFINEWMGTRYLWGGNSEDGIDCSAFVQRLYNSVYDVNIPRTSIEQFYTKWVELYKNPKYLKEGDLVFFKTIKNYNAVTHVGFYLHNGYFVNASSSKGVSLGSLNDNYWSVKYVAAGRLKRKYLDNKN